MSDNFVPRSDFEALQDKIAILTEYSVHMSALMMGVIIDQSPGAERTARLMALAEAAQDTLKSEPGLGALLQETLRRVTGESA